MKNQNSKIKKASYFSGLLILMTCLIAPWEVRISQNTVIVEQYRYIKFSPIFIPPSGTSISEKSRLDQIGKGAVIQKLVYPKWNFIFSEWILILGFYGVWLFRILKWHETTEKHLVRMEPV